MSHWSPSREFIAGPPDNRSHLNILNILLVLVSRAPYTTEKPRPTPNLWRVQLATPGLASKMKVLRKQRRTRRVRIRRMNE